MALATIVLAQVAPRQADQGDIAGAQIAKGPVNDDVEILPVPEVAKAGLLKQRAIRLRDAVPDQVAASPEVPGTVAENDVGREG